jgi:hypothetical protein
MAKYLAICIALAGAPLCQASDNVLEPLTPIKKPVKAEKKEDVAKVAELLKLGAQDKKDAIQRLKRGIREGQPFAEIAPNSIRDISRRKIYFPTLLDVKKGEIGVLRDTSWYSVGLMQFDVMQVIDEENMLIKIDDDKFYWLSGFSTEGIADADTVEGIAAVLEVVGTKKYNTAIGTRTVPWLKPYPFDLDPKPQPKAEAKK